jgi:hypothetical protein
VPGSDAVAADVERIQAGAHELLEVRLLNALRTGEVALRAEQEEEALRLLGTAGADLGGDGRGAGGRAVAGDDPA